MTQSPGAEEEPLVVSELAGSWGVVTYPDHILSERCLSMVVGLQGKGEEVVFLEPSEV